MKQLKQLPTGNQRTNPLDLLVIQPEAIMVGGRILETIILEDKIWINCIDTHNSDECAIYVEKTPESRTASKGDKLWWQGRSAYWTPTNSHSLTGEDITGPVEVELERIGYSGVSRPTEPEVV